MAINTYYLQIMQLRNYELLEAEVEKQLHLSSWDSLVQDFREIWDKSGDIKISPLEVQFGTLKDTTPGGPYYNFFTKNAYQRFDGIQNQVPRGKIRDAILRILMLDDVTGIDTNLLDSFSELNGNSLNSLRDGVREIATPILWDQIERGDTFFFEVEKMLSSPYHDLVNSIIDVRRKELLSLGENAKLKDIVSTYYGFKIALEGTIGTENVGVSKEVHSAIAQIIESLGGFVSIEANQGRFLRSNLFKCSQEKAELLEDVLSLGIGGRDATEAAVESLLVTCDSRPIDILVRKLESPSSKQVRYQLIDLLAAIGSPKALQALKTIAETKHEIATNAILAIGHVRDTKSVGYLLDIGKAVFRNDSEWSSGFSKRMQTTLLALGKTENLEVLPILEKALFHSWEEICLSALVGLTVFGKYGDEVIVGNMDRVSQIVVGFTSPTIVIGILLAIPDILENQQFTTSVAKRIGIDPRKTHYILREFNKYKVPEIPPVILESSIASLEHDPFYLETIQELKMHPTHKSILQDSRIEEIMKRRAEFWRIR
ncbi:MAG: HEAT repeat domain-containing protein [Candidatus Thorarchaeota archaeon]